MRKQETYGDVEKVLGAQGSTGKGKQRADIRIRYRVGRTCLPLAGLLLVPGTGCLPRKPLLYQSL